MTHFLPLGYHQTLFHHASFLQTYRSPLDSALHILTWARSGQRERDEGGYPDMPGRLQVI